MTRTFVASDHHFGHPNIVKFGGEDGIPHRKFSSYEEHDEYLIQQHNSGVGINDKVYFLGDFAINKKAIKLAARLNGRKTLIMGNHDIFNTKEYTPYFDNVRAYRVLNVGDTRHRIILSHIPIHEGSINRFSFNVHGHLHANVLAHENYLNVSMEQLDDYKPLDLQVILDDVIKYHEEKDATQ